jgi:hypothetical protein
MKLFEALPTTRLATRAIAATILLILGACSEKPSPTGAAQKPAAPASAREAAVAESAFAEKVPEAIAGDFALRSDCNMESFAGKPFTAEPQKLALGQPLAVSGWVADVGGGGVPSAVFLRAHTADKQRIWYAPIALTMDRGDIAAKYGNNDAFRRSGYDAKIRTTGLPAGTYGLLVVYAGKAEKALCDNGRTLVVD